MKDRFYLACLRDNTGSNIAFHGRGGCGYTTDIDKAKVYTREQAQHEWDTGREFDLPISADHIDALAVYKVDMQYIPNETPVNSAALRWVGFQCGLYDGNDVCWLTGKLPSFDFSEAKVFDFLDVDINDDKITYLPLEVPEKAKRRTFDYSKLNKRTMVQGAGLITPDRIKKARRRVSSPQTRMNCPCCGRINWQFNPHDFEGCSNVFCEEYGRWI